MCVATAVATLLGAACASDAKRAPATSTTGLGGATGTITVFAAASLTGAFTEIGKAFQTANPDATVKFNFASSSTLANQVNQGAPADVFASADDANMKRVTDAGNSHGDPVEFATNKLQVIVGKDNPKGITSVTDLTKSSITSITCDPAVPIGAYTQEVFRKAGITVKPKSLEPDVKGIVTKVTAGEADAGVVYATDVLAAKASAQGVVIPDEWNVVAHYPLTVLRQSHNTGSASVFMNYVLSRSGQEILAKWAFTGTRVP